MIVATVTLTIAKSFLEKAMFDQGLVAQVKLAADELSERLNYRADTPGEKQKIMHGPTRGVRRSTCTKTTGFKINSRPSTPPH